MKNNFKILKENKNLVYMDSGASCLKPESVISKLNEYYEQYPVNIHRGVYEMSERASEKYEKSREEVAKFIGATEKNEVVITSGTTESINMVARGLEKFIEKGDEILVSELEHHSNLVPWQELAKRRGGELKYIKIDTNFKLNISKLNNLISKKTKILALAHVSNVVGTVNPIKKIAQIAKKINPDILLVVDGAQAVGHMKIDVKELGADFYAFSGHKMYGPMGVGILWGKKKLLEEMEPMNFGGGMISEVSKNVSKWARVPDKFEAGTRAVGEVIALREAILFLKKNGFGIEKEVEMIKIIKKKMEKIGGVRTFSSLESGILSFVVEGIHSHDVAEILNRSGVAVRSGHHCAQVLHQMLGIKDSVRVSLGIYNRKDEIDKLIEGIKEVKRIFNK